MDLLALLVQRLGRTVNPAARTVATANTVTAIKIVLFFIFSKRGYESIRIFEEEGYNYFLEVDISESNISRVSNIKNGYIQSAYYSMTQ